MASEEITQQTINDDYIDSLKSTHPFEGIEENYGPEILELLKRQGRIIASLNDVQQRLRLGGNGQANKDSMDEALESAKADAHRCFDSIHMFLGNKVWFTKPTAYSGMKASEVFDLPELAEMIFLGLNSADIWFLAQTNQGIAASIGKSRKLQRRLCLEPDPKSAWTSLFGREIEGHANFLGSHLRCEVGDRFTFFGNPQTTYEGWGIVFASIRALLGEPRRFNVVPEKFHKLLICQPPIYRMLAMASCCHSREAYDSRPRFDEPVEIRSETGITVADLMSAGEKLFEFHRICPHAPHHMHDDNGFVRPEVDFVGQLKLNRHEERYGQPNASFPRDTAGDNREPKSGSNHQSEDEEVYKDYLKKKVVLNAYMEYKLTALQQNDPIPTMEEWRSLMGGSVTPMVVHDDQDEHQIP